MVARVARGEQRKHDVVDDDDDGGDDDDDDNKDDDDKFKGCVEQV